MKIRTITAGCNISKGSTDVDTKKINQIADELHTIKQYFIDQEYSVQTLRFSTQPWEFYASTQKQLDRVCSRLQSFCPDQFDYFNIGPVSAVDHISWLPSVLKKYPVGFCTVNLCKNNKVELKNAWEAAKLIKKISKIEKQGFANLRFAALCNIQPNTPFYPASFHQGKPSFSIGCENGDIIYSVFSQADSFDEAYNLLNERLSEEYQRIERIALDASEETNLSFNGIDVSISPSVIPDESLVYGIEKLSFVDNYGGPGSLAASRLITSVLEKLVISSCGYNGLMLPVMEDMGLAQRNKEGHLTLTKLLSFSSVCGTGLDTIPLPGNSSVESLYA
ncbi:MAG: DUF711 family protein, partial [Candidatus Thermoplasmatota archaeon]|nr:DUF711 family protein [Candidatus Thermoplasmatota archaeon]